MGMNRVYKAGYDDFGDDFGSPTQAVSAPDKCSEDYELKQQNLSSCIPAYLPVYMYVCLLQTYVAPCIKTCSETYPSQNVANWSIEIRYVVMILDQPSSSCG